MPGIIRVSHLSASTRTALESFFPPASTRSTEGCFLLLASRDARIAPAGPAPTTTKSNLSGTVEPISNFKTDMERWTRFGSDAMGSEEFADGMSRTLFGEEPNASSAPFIVHKASSAGRRSRPEAGKLKAKEEIWIL